MELTLEECPGVERAEVERLLAIELGERTVTSRVELSLSCQPAGVLLEAKNERAEAVRALDLEEVRGTVGARVLSLSAVELLREVESAPEPLEVTESRKAAPPSNPSTARVLLGVEMMSFSLDPPAGGPTASVELFGLRPLYVLSGVSVHVGRRNFPSGYVTTRSLGGKVELGFRHVKERAGFALGGGYRLASVHLVGHSSEQSRTDGSVSGVFAGPYGTLATETRWGDSWSLRIHGELGVVQVPVRGEVSGDDDVAVDGAWVTLGISVGRFF